MNRISSSRVAVSLRLPTDGMGPKGMDRVFSLCCYDDFLNLKKSLFHMLQLKSLVHGQQSPLCWVSGKADYNGNRGGTDRDWIRAITHPSKAWTGDSVPLTKVPVLTFHHFLKGPPLGAKPSTHIQSMQRTISFTQQIPTQLLILTPKTPSEERLVQCLPK